MNTEDRWQALDGDTRKLLHYLDLALGSIEAGQEAAFINFVAKLLEMLYYNAGYNKIVYMCHALPSVICGVSSLVQTDVYVMDNKILFVQISLDLKDPGPQAIGEAIAAYAMKNKIQVSSLHLPPLQDITFPTIATALSSTKLPLPQIWAMLFSKERIFKPKQPFFGMFLLPKCHGLGMRSLENRVEILMCLEAFKQFFGN